MTNENNPTDFSSNDPITEAAGLEAVLGMINPKELGQVEQDSVDETESEIIEDNDANLNKNDKEIHAMTKIKKNL